VTCLATSWTVPAQAAPGAVAQRRQPDPLGSEAGEDLPEALATVRDLGEQLVIARASVAAEPDLAERRPPGAAGTRCPRSRGVLELFQPARTDCDWLSRDEAIVDAYVADPGCGFGIDTDSARAMFAGARRGADPAQVAAIKSSLPVYIAVGEADPVNGGLALLTPLTERYEAAGLTDVTTRTYPDARHEILNETNRDEVIAELISWLDRVVEGSAQRG
jgi:hypothetical protein